MAKAPARGARSMKQINETRYQAGGDDEIGAVRVERGLLRNRDGSVDHSKFAWKVYQFVELSEEQKRQFTANPTNPEEEGTAEPGTVLKEADWKHISQHAGGDDDGEAAALEAAEGLMK